MKETAVEWLVNELKTSKHYQRVINEVNQSSTEIKDVINQAKAMEKEQLDKAFDNGRNEEINKGSKICYRVYGLYVDGQELIRYIGFTKKKIQTRLNEHTSESKYLKTKKDRWIQKYLRNEKQICAIELDSTFDFEEVKKKEINLIAMYKSCGANLMNGTNGGDGSINYRPTEEAKIANGISKSKKVYCFDFKTKELIADYPSITKMIKELKLSKTLVAKVLNGSSNFHKDFTFSKDGICPTPFTPKHTAWNKGISTKGTQRFRFTETKLEKDGEITTFESLQNAADFLGKHRSFVTNKRKLNQSINGYKII
jgi:hypothetical protein